MAILAIDPGLSGAVCRLSDTVELRRDFKTHADIATAILDLSPGCTDFVIELVHAMPGQGVCSMFSFGKATGVAFGAIALCKPTDVPLTEVAPQRWQNFFRRLLDIPKTSAFDSRDVVSRLLSDHRHLFARKKDHNSADAVLMALWRQMTREVAAAASLD